MYLSACIVFCRTALWKAARQRCWYDHIICSNYRERAGMSARTDSGACTANASRTFWFHSHLNCKQIYLWQPVCATVHVTFLLPLASCGLLFSPRIIIPCTLFLYRDLRAYIRRPQVSRSFTALHLQFKAASYSRPMRNSMVITTLTYGSVRVMLQNYCTGIDWTGNSSVSIGTELRLYVTPQDSRQE